MDLGHQLTDEELAKLERKIAKVYKTAADEMQDKITEYFKKFDEQDKKKRALLEQGKITEQEYKQWRLGKLATGKKYQSMRDQLAERMTNANQEAVAYVNSSTPTVYSINRNYTAYQIEQADINASFQLWDESTVARLIKDNPELMPNYPKEKALARGIDLDWGKKQISKEITTGILLGESNQSIAKRLLTELPDMNKASAIRTARTATTSAECAGRQDTYESAKAMGIVLKKRWMCTHDARTREEHLAADGQSVDVDKPFEVGGEKLMNPGDTSGSAWNIMNCRCTTVADIDTKASAKNKNPVSFNKWVEQKSQDGQPENNLGDVYYNSKTLKSQYKDIEAMNEYEYFSKEQEQFRLQSIMDLTGYDEKEAKKVLEAFSGNGDKYLRVANSGGVYNPHSWFYGGDSEIRTAKDGEAFEKAKLIDKYIENAPKYEGEIYRGLALDKDVISSFKTGSIFKENGNLSSWTNSREAAEMFANGRAEELGKKQVILKTQNPKYGTPVSHLSIFGNEESEVLVSNMRQGEYLIDSVTEEDGIVIVNLILSGG